MSESRPLEGIRVADFSRILAGPLCTMMLADAGADVIKIESPEGDETRRWGPPFIEGESAYFLSINRNKRSVILDLTLEQDRDSAMKLISESDVVVENFLPQQQRKLGISPEITRSANPRAVHCGIRGHDADSARADAPGFDLLAQAGSGLMSITGPPDGPPTKAGVALADVITAHWAHGAILAALIERTRTGEGSVVEVSLAGAMTASLINVAQSFLMTGDDPKRYGNQHPSITPYQPYPTSDGWIAIGATSEKQFEALCREVLDVPELLDDSRFQSNLDRVLNRSVLDETVEALLRTRDSGYWLDLCDAARVPASPVADIPSILTGESAPISTAFHSTIGEVKTVRNPIRRNGRYQTRFSPPPRLGEHQQILDRPEEAWEQSSDEKKRD